MFFFKFLKGGVNSLHGRVKCTAAAVLTDTYYVLYFSFNTENGNSRLISSKNSRVM
jgi:hypothetical protein